MYSRFRMFLCNIESSIIWSAVLVVDILYLLSYCVESFLSSLTHSNTTHAHLMPFTSGLSNARYWHSWPGGLTLRQLPAVKEKKRNCSPFHRLLRFKGSLSFVNPFPNLSSFGAYAPWSLIHWTFNHGAVWGSQFLCAGLTLNWLDSDKASCLKIVSTNFIHVMLQSHSTIGSKTPLFGQAASGPPWQSSTSRALAASWAQKAEAESGWI